MSSLAKWARRWPDANIGIVTGEKVTVIDIDNASLITRMIRRFGDTPLQVRSPSGGLHLYYASSGEDCSDLRPRLLVDIKGVGGYVAAPPSVRPSGEFAGRRYEIVRGSWDDLSRLPVLRPSSLRHSTTTAPLPHLRAIEVGRRNKTLFRQLLRHARHCDEFDALVDVARTINDSCDPPLPDAEVLKTAKSAWRYEVEAINWAGRSARVHIKGEEIAQLVAAAPVDLATDGAREQLPAAKASQRMAIEGFIEALWRAVRFDHSGRGLEMRRLVQRSAHAFLAGERIYAAPEIKVAR